MRNPALTGLTAEENQLLPALVHFPEETDRRLGEMSSQNPSKAAYIRTRMQKLGIFRYVRIPAFGRLGAELFWAGIFEMGPGGEGQTAYERLKSVLEEMPGIFWAIADGDLVVVLGIFWSKAEVAADVAQLEKVQGVVKRESIILPAASLEKGNFFNFSQVLNRPVGAPEAGPENTPGEPAGRFRPLLGFEKEALQALVDFPDDGAAALASRLGIPTMLFLERTEEIERERLYWIVAVPDFRLLGREALAVWTDGAVAARTKAETAVQERQAPSQDAPHGEEDTLEDQPSPEPVVGDPLPLDTGMVPEVDAVLPKGLPDELKDDSIPDQVEEQCAVDVAVNEQEPAAAEAGGKVVAPKTSPEPDTVKMPWQLSPMSQPSKPRYAAPRHWESGSSGGKRGIEALPKDIARTLIGRPSKEAVEQAKAELERRRLWDINLDQILQDAGVLPAKRAVPAAPPLPPAWARLAGEIQSTQPAEGVMGRVTVAGRWGNRAIGGNRADKVIQGKEGKEALPSDGGNPEIPVVAGTEPTGLAIATVKRKRGRPPKVPMASPDGMSETIQGAIPAPTTPAMVTPVKRKRGRPPKVRGAPINIVAVTNQKMGLTILATGNAQVPAPVIKRKRGRPRKHPVNGNLAMAVQKFSMPVDEKDQLQALEQTEPETRPKSLPVFLDAKEAGQRIMLGLIREKDGAPMADEHMLLEAGPGLILYLMPVAKLRVVKDLEFGPVLKRILTNS